MTRSFPTEVVLSLTTRRLLCEFSDMHACAEFLTGGPVWTHQFAHEPFADEMRDAIYEQHPHVRTVDASAVTSENWRPFRDACCAQLGATLDLAPMATVKTLGDSFTEPLAHIGSAQSRK